MMKFTLPIFLSVSISLSVLYTSSAQADLPNYENNNDVGQMCSSGSAYEERLDRLLFDKVPSLMEDCGIGGLFDICGMLGSVGSIVGPFIGQKCGQNGLSGGSLFCGWTFNLESAKEAYWAFQANQRHNLSSEETQSLYASAQTTGESIEERRLSVFGLTSESGS